MFTIVKIDGFGYGQITFDTLEKAIDGAIWLSKQTQDSEYLIMGYNFVGDYRGTYKNGKLLNV